MYCASPFRSVVFEKNDKNISMDTAIEQAWTKVPVP